MNIATDVCIFADDCLCGSHGPYDPPKRWIDTRTSWIARDRRTNQPNRVIALGWFTVAFPYDRVDPKGRRAERVMFGIGLCFVPFIVSRVLHRYQGHRAIRGEFPCVIAIIRRDRSFDRMRSV